MSNDTNPKAQNSQDQSSASQQTEPQVRSVLDLPPPSKKALRFIKRAHANPHFRKLMKDLADK